MCVEGLRTIRWGWGSLVSSEAYDLGCGGYLFLLFGSFGVFLPLARLSVSLFLAWGFRAHPCTANHHNNGVPDQEGLHHSYEVPLAYHGAPAFCMSALLLTPRSMPHNEARRTMRKLLFTRVRGGAFYEGRMQHPA